MAIQRDKIVASAEKLVGKGKIEAAVKEYERLLDDNPNDVNTLNRIGDLWVKINRTDEAVKVFTRIADHYSRDGFFLKAIAIFKKINKLDPSRLEIYARLADLYAKQGLAMEAKGQYQVLADYYLKHGDPNSALATYRKIAELDPNSLNVHVKLADLYSQVNQTAEALKEYDRVGKMLLKRGMLDEAAQVYRKALKIDPGNIELAESLSTALIEAKDFDTALQILQGVHDSNPDHPRVVSLLGRVHLGRGDVRSAERVLAQGIATHPGDAAMSEMLAELYLRQGNADSALNMLGPLVDAAADRGDRAAVEMLQRVIRADASHVPTQEKLVEVYKKLNEETNILSSMNSLAEAHISAGNFAAATTILEDLIKREPENAQHKKKLAFVRDRVGGRAPAEAPAPDFMEPAPAEVELDFDMGPSASLDFGLAPPPMAPPPAPDLSGLGEQDAGGDDLDFITEHLTEAEVFAKYGLAEKAIEHLEAVLDRSPKNVQALEKLMQVQLDEGDTSSAGSTAGRLIAAHEEAADFGAADAVRSLLAGRGVSLSPAGAKPQPVAEEIPDIELEVEETPVLEFDQKSVELSFEEPAAPALQEEEIPVEELSIDELSSDEEILLEPPSLEAPIDFDAGLAGAATPEEEIPVEEEISFEPEAASEPSVELSFEEPGIEIELEDEAPAAGSPESVGEPEAALEFQAAEEEEPEIQFDLTPDEPVVEEPVIEPAVEEPLAEPEPEPELVVGPALEELGEIDFYLEQELIDEASEKLAGLERRFPGDEQVAQRRAQVDERVRAARAAAEAAAAAATAPETDLLAELREEVEEETAAPAKPTALDENLFAEEDNFFDLAAELEQELADEGEPITIAEEEQSLEEIFREFKRGVEQQLDAEDYDTHYNLGIAYKEMGLIDEAIGEFQLASKDPKRMIECCSMLGLCFLEKGMPQLAIKWYQKGLEAPEISSDEHLGLLYDLGSVYLEVGDIPNAQKAFFEVYGINSNYRDIVSRIKQLEDVAR